jgi:hypothetical protein
LSEWTKDKEKKVLVKYRFLLTARIIRVLLIIGFLYVIYMVALSIGYDQSKLSARHSHNMNLAIDWTQAGVYGEFDAFPDSEISPLLTQEISIPLYRTIGKEESPIGTMTLNKRLFTPFSSKETEFFRPVDQKRFQFYLPENPETGKSHSLNNEMEEVWEPLEMVHEGTVADLAFSTNQYFEPEELLRLLESYDLDVLWMPLYAGELKEIEDIPYSVAGGTYMTVDTLGLSRAREVSDDYMSFSELYLRSDRIQEIQKIMLKNMENLIEEESNTYLEQILGLRFLEERHDYLDANGFQVYGAVVTGPVKELLKLKELDEIQAVQLGEFDYWNWEKTEE